MSNIPNNTVASMLGTTSLSRQLGAANARETQEAVRAQRVQSRKNEQHAEEVENLDEGAVDAIHDEQKRHTEDEAKDHKRQASEDPTEQVDIAELKDAPRPATKATPHGLDISA